MEQDVCVAKAEIGVEIVASLAAAEAASIPAVAAACVE